MHQPNYLFHFYPVEESTFLDYIIVGQGLAGSAIALQLLKRGKKILIIDELSQNTSSRIAAGLFNPVTGKNASKTWMADALFPYLHQFYTDAEHVTGGKFFNPMPLYRPFASALEQNEWMAKSADDHLKSYIEAVHVKPQFDGIVKDQFGGLLLKQCGYLNTLQYLKSVRTYLGSVARVVEERFMEELLEINGQHIAYRQWKARKIIFCLGERSTTSMWFKDLPIRPLKGETLTIKTDWKKDVILNRGVYMVPGMVSGEFRVGATYNLDDLTPEITAEAREELEKKLNELACFPYEVEGQTWGLRPTTRDRRPILGSHPKYDRIVIFNGLGTKGVSLAPYFSEVLVRWLENSEVLNKEVSITRYK